MKIIGIAWRDPDDNLKYEQFEDEKFKISTDASWLKILSKEHGHIWRLIPACRVRIVEYGEVKDKPRILTPEAAMSSAGMTS